MPSVRQWAPVQPDARVPIVRDGAAEHDLDAALVRPLAALRLCDGDGAAALVLAFDDDARGRLAREMVRRPALFPAPVIRAVLASTPKPVLGRTMGIRAASVAWRCYVQNDGSNV